LRRRDDQDDHDPDLTRWHPKPLQRRVWNMTESERCVRENDLGVKVESDCAPCVFFDPAPGIATGQAVMSSEGAARGLILVVEDESAIADVMRLNLARAGYGVHLERDGTSALAAIRALKPAAVILDIGLPGLDGIEVCRRLRSDNDWTPVLFVTARDDEVDRIVGLELGADDYVTKPFSPRELVARVTSVLRRSQGGPGDQLNLVVGGVRLDPAERRVFVDELEVELTATEFDLLGYLMRRPGRVFSREQLISDVWGYSPAGSVRTVDVHIAQVRVKLGEASPIRTVRGVGYAVDNPASRRGLASDGEQ
jgi:DNA-binding response OmpR family regulator